MWANLKFALTFKPTLHLSSSKPLNKSSWIWNCCPHCSLYVFYDHTIEPHPLQFMQDAEEVMQLLLKVQTEQGEELEDDDPQVSSHTHCCKWWCCLLSLQISYMISAWARMCKILGDQFVQYLPVVMKPVLLAAKMKPEVAIIDCKWQSLRLYVVWCNVFASIRLSACTIICE